MEILRKKMEARREDGREVKVDVPNNKMAKRMTKLEEEMTGRSFTVFFTRQCVFHSLQAPFFSK